MNAAPEQGFVRWLWKGAFRRLAYAAWGSVDAPRLAVCVHGLTRQGRDFDALAAALAGRGWRVLCPDLPGRGRSDWLAEAEAADYALPTYAVALSHLLASLPEARAVDWIGTSLGGLAGMVIAAAPGNPLRRLVLNDVGPFLPAAALKRIGSYVGETRRFADLPALEAYLRQVHAPFGPLTDAQWRHLAAHGARALPDGGLALHYDPAIAAPFRAMAASGGAEGGASGDVDLWPVWERIAAPTLVLRGEHSDLLAPEIVGRMCVRPGVRAAVIGGCGHAPALMDAAQIALVADWLDGR
ncbi:MAG: alpha/beta hydrolase [Alphaproteobacteria bacterium]|nr:alpha/beta hydrolase [Alphaproteobacteria bacterium]